MAVSSNTFTKGMVTDINELNMSNDTMTSALNATLATFNGNEGILQNDMGNCKIVNDNEIAYIPKGYIPIGSKEFGGIIYYALVAKGDEDHKCLIGCFPSPDYSKKSSSLIYLYLPLRVGYEEDSIMADYHAKIRISDSVFGVEDPNMDLENIDPVKLFEGIFDSTKDNYTFKKISYLFSNCVCDGKKLRISLNLIGATNGSKGSQLTRLLLKEFEGLTFSGQESGTLHIPLVWRIPTPEEMVRILGSLKDKRAHSNPTGFSFVGELGDVINFPFGGLSVIKKEIANLFSLGLNLQGGTSPYLNAASQTSNSDNDQLGDAESKARVRDLSDPIIPGDNPTGDALPEDEPTQDNTGEDLTDNPPVINFDASSSASSKATVNESATEFTTNELVESTSSVSSGLLFDPNNYNLILNESNCYIWVHVGDEYKIARLFPFKVLETKNEKEGDFEKYTEEYSIQTTQLIPELVIDTITKSTTDNTDGANNPLLASIQYVLYYKDKKTKVLTPVREDGTVYDTKEEAELSKEEIIIDFLKTYYGDGLTEEELADWEAPDIDEYPYSLIERAIMKKYTLEKFKANVYLITENVGTTVEADGCA